MTHSVAPQPVARPASLPLALEPRCHDRATGVNAGWRIYIYDCAVAQVGVGAAGQGLAKLSDDAFGAVVNGVVPEPYAAEVGRAISDPAQQMAAIQILHQAEPANAEQARLLVQDVKNSGFLDGTQEDMFGSQAFAQSLFPERAKVLGQALQTLRGNKKVFQSAVAGEDTLTAAGNTLDTEANQKGQTENERLIDTLQRSATSRGPISDALSAAARDVASGKQVRGASADFLAKAGHLSEAERAWAWSTALITNEQDRRARLARMAQQHRE